MKALGIGLDGEYMVALEKHEWMALQQLRAVAKEAGDDCGLAEVLTMVRLFLDARIMMDDLQMLLDRYQRLVCSLPGDEPYSELGDRPRAPRQLEPAAVRKTRRPREAGPRPSEGSGT